MKKYIKYLFLIAFFILLINPNCASAHQPRIVSDDVINIYNPEVSQAFYGELRGKPAEFVINSGVEFKLYIGLLVPDISGVSKDISAEIYLENSGTKVPLVVLDGASFNWTPFYEEFAKDNYFWGPEFKADDSQKGIDLKGRLVPPGEYHIKIYNAVNLGKYSMAVGYIETFPVKEMVGALTNVASIKTNFFNESITSILLSPFGWGSILFYYILALILWALLRIVLRQTATKEAMKIHCVDMAKNDRVFRLALGLGLLLWAIYTTWNPVILIISGFLVFEASLSQKKYLPIRTAKK